MNIYDIAEKCGVSIATVSRVLNNNPNVSAATRDRILAVIEQENYTPSALARRLGNGEADPAEAGVSAPAVGVLCPDLRSPYYGELLARLEQGLSARNLALLLVGGVTTPEAQQAAIAALAEKGVKATVAIDPAHSDGAPLTAVGDAPLILVDGQAAAPRVYGIGGDHHRAVGDIVKQLMGRQRRRILFLYSRMSHSCRQKLEGYRAAYAAAGLAVDPALIVEVDSSPEAVNTVIKQLLVKRVTFDAVIGAEDVIALGALKALGRTGLSMPIIGYHNVPIARCSTPALTSVDSDPEATCTAALEVLDRLLDGQSAPENTLVPTKLVERDTFRNA